MPQIGTFTRQSDRFIGRIHTFAYCREIIIVPADASDTENAPDYRIHLDPGDGTECGPEIGAAWKRNGERAGSFIALIIDDPTLPQTIRANLFRDGAEGASWSLHWSRTNKRDARD
ncbi:DUF736 domain-containing protein [Novosphingobium sp. CECT 9465]|uniref:DUF736 domain-containing protein n=1 Tax=Novosphingobium sp. CECT 9465 TaxID=2829794 RepID=UPI001E33B67B|nr:DUF736 domain-containing protein [Novosphingobium sp. CECT 9465]CAH0497816.1 hypothetical protein NVSP9465_02886 [Novosphingobium sp. CECT 9465]